MPGNTTCSVERTGQSHRPQRRCNCRTILHSRPVRSSCRRRRTARRSDCNSRSGRIGRRHMLRTSRRTRRGRTFCRRRRRYREKASSFSFWISSSRLRVEHHGSDLRGLPLAGGVGSRACDWPPPWTEGAGARPGRPRAPPGCRGATRNRSASARAHRSGLGSWADSSGGKDAATICSESGHPLLRRLWPILAIDGGRAVAHAGGGPLRPPRSSDESTARWTRTASIRSLGSSLRRGLAATSVAYSLVSPFRPCLRWPDPNWPRPKARKGERRSGQPNRHADRTAPARRAVVMVAGSRAALASPTRRARAEPASVPKELRSVAPSAHPCVRGAGCAIRSPASAVRPTADRAVQLAPMRIAARGHARWSPLLSIHAPGEPSCNRATSTPSARPEPAVRPGSASSPRLERVQAAACSRSFTNVWHRRIRSRRADSWGRCYGNRYARSQLWTSPASMTRCAP
jgi:hypothetical protein